MEPKAANSEKEITGGEALVGGSFTFLGAGATRGDTLTGTD
jgi:hypothetical protein|tara:strand:+ start:526 stop:648 length:123 start_codon:yes stop_codon:yes gene_type:complete